MLDGEVEMKTVPFLGMEDGRKMQYHLNIMTQKRYRMHFLPACVATTYGCELNRSFIQHACLRKGYGYTLSLTCPREEADKLRPIFNTIVDSIRYVGLCVCVCVYVGLCSP